VISRKEADADIGTSRRLCCLCKAGPPCGGNVSFVLVATDLRPVDRVSVDGLTRDLERSLRSEVCQPRSGVVSISAILKVEESPVSGSLHRTSIASLGFVRIRPRFVLQSGLVAQPGSMPPMVERHAESWNADRAARSRSSHGLDLMRDGMPMRRTGLLPRHPFLWRAIG
jgi:hypothetical protein